MVTTSKIIESLVQFLQAFRQIHFDSLLVQVDPFQIRVRERDQRLLVLAIHLQNLGATQIEHVGNGSNVLAVDRKYAAALQLKRIKPALLWR